MASDGVAVRRGLSRYGSFDAHYTIPQTGVETAAV